MSYYIYTIYSFAFSFTHQEYANIFHDNVGYFQINSSFFHQELKTNEEQHVYSIQEIMRLICLPLKI